MPQRAFSAAVLAADADIWQKSHKLSLSALQCSAIITKYRFVEAFLKHNESILEASPTYTQ